MSLDVYLSKPNGSRSGGTGIFVRENGSTREITREEWNERFPGLEPVVVTKAENDDEVYSANITHNLTKMAEAAGIYKHLWRPEEIGISKAAQLIEPLREGLNVLISNPDKYREHNPANGWGSYEGLVEFVGRYLCACKDNPDAEVRACRMTPRQALLTVLDEEHATKG